ncbi:DNA photolyase family protein [Burkholderia pseudomultivorans]|uniref:cryptochrome/photolyase family protein n=1 Tax=Burkholderia pseudomultivorans TaxID=1207504 RepID=UPI00075D19E6|nr:deoxyribodipyrimidine photo-lyase [Burkholderia pseudomultivorans]KVC27910.1 deoxyribodipyrimidine photolyase [Burkholderia pseudomultivorans]KVC39977.1 deoxyribodipyrimidine photolyase [Burkholderia pseudomultivorans]MDS0797356.1 DNA photolyase family protein [Burkholderia pseudomultivorans]
MPVPSSVAPAIVWFRDDLRLTDQPALARAVASGRPLVCVFVDDTGAGAGRPLGGAARWWLHGSLAGLDAALARRGGRLLLLRGDARHEIERIAHDTGAAAVYWNRRYAQPQRDADAALKASLKARGLAVESSNGSLLNEPWEVLTGAGAPFQVFTAYWRAARRDRIVEAPLPAPAHIAFHPWPDRVRERALALDALALRTHTPDWAGGLRDAWPAPDEAGAHARLDAFVNGSLAGYAQARDRPDQPATSRLSPFLRFGNVSPRQVWHAVQGAAQAGGAAWSAGADKFLSELGWREFSYALLYHFPSLASDNFRAQFDAMPWRDDPAALRAWQRGRTGYPLVDAGLRELWTTGWMHNRVRMVVASFLAKHLLIDWRAGEAWFRDTLVDADPANNAASWQWVAGCGVDAAPYFRIFNPVAQGRRFDPHGAYVRRWVPELAGLDDAAIHAPWEASPLALAAAGVRLGVDYPAPLVDHDAARRRALDALAALPKRR